MYVVNLSAELFPLAKAGGLGDVLQGLSLELARQGAEVEIILPKYKNIHLEKLKNFHMEYQNIPSYENEIWHSNTIYSAATDNVKITLIEDHHPKHYFDRDQIYGYSDDTCRFIYFCRAALEYLIHQKRKIDILHLHEWHTAAAAPLYRSLFMNKLPIKSIVLTMHNLEHQGRCTFQDLYSVGVNDNQILEKMRDDNPAYYNNLNLLKGGIVYSNAITTVSPTYGKEILKDQGFWLESALHKNINKLHPILNGIDDNVYNPAHDPLIAEHFSATYAPEHIKEAKWKNHEYLSKKVGLSTEKKPLIASIGRLVPQKGPELIKHAIFQTLRKGGKFILLGSSPIKEIADEFAQLKERFKDNKNVSFNFEYNEALSHLIYAASDFLVIPSLFEPCGLTQMIAFRYGTIPIVRKTGGLADTVFEIDEQKNVGNGFTFTNFDIEGINSALNKALDLYAKGKTLSIAQQVMHIDHSWKKAASEYLDLYKGLLK